jgi:hypothetical protein
MSIWYWIAIVVVVILLIVLITLFARERGKNKKSWTVKPPAKIVFISSPQTIKAGSVSGMITIQIQDVNGNPVNVASSTVITLSSSPSGIFGTNTDGLPAITSVTVYGGTDSANFYFKGSTKGNAIITASYSGLASGTQTETIT